MKNAPALKTIICLITVFSSLAHSTGISDPIQETINRLRECEVRLAYLETIELFSPRLWRIMMGPTAPFPQQELLSQVEYAETIARQMGYESNPSTGDGEVERLVAVRNYARALTRHLDTFESHLLGLSTSLQLITRPGDVNYDRLREVGAYVMTAAETRPWVETFRTRMNVIIEVSQSVAQAVGIRPFVLPQAQTGQNLVETLQSQLAALTSHIHAIQLANENSNATARQGISGNDLNIGSKPFAGSFGPGGSGDRAPF